MSSFTQNNIVEAVQALIKEELVVFPTETVYGLGARADSSIAIQKIYDAKGRPSNNPLIIHFHSLHQIKEWLTLPPLAEKLGNKFWPGPLTLIIRSSEKICSTARAGLNTVAIRIPSHPIALELLRQTNLPLAAPSANRSGHISPTQVEHVKRSLGSKVKIILDGGACEVGLESTVLDLTTNPPRILRPGKISREEIEKEIGNVELADHKVSENKPLASPGLLFKHYSPDAKVVLFTSSELESYLQPQEVGTIGILFHSSDLKIPNSDAIKAIELSNDPKQYAQQLYAALHELESLGCKLIIVENIPQNPQWKAIENRLSRMISE